MSQCERSAVCRAQAGEGSRLRPYHVRKILFITGRRRVPPGKGTGMPELSRFYGIVITMYSEAGGNHSLPHIHVRYGNMRAVYSLQGDLLRGKMPSKQHKLVLAWMALHEQELQENWYLGISRALRCFPCSTVYSFNTLPPFAAKTQLVPVNAAAPERRCFSWHTPENKNHRPFTEHGSKKGFIPRKPPHRAFSPPASSTTTEGARTCRRWS